MIYHDYGTENEYLIGISAQDKCFGEYGCFSGNPSTYTALANEDTIVMEIPKSDLHHFISLNPRNAEEIFGSMAKQIAMLSKNIEMLRNEG